MTPVLVSNAVQINLSTPISGSWQGRGFGRHFVWQYLCSRGHTVNVRCSAWRGFGKHRQPDTVPGAIMCPQCDLDS
jgi:hypothetical protein